MHGDEIISGCVNMTGLLENSHHQGVRRIHRLQDSRPGGECLLPQVPLGGISSPGSPVSTPPPSAIGALALAILPPLAADAGLLGLAPAWGDWIYRALTFLVISCPCALVISIPLSFFAGIGGASNARRAGQGLQLSGDALPRPNIVVFDKTGTLTQGVFEVTGIHHNTIDEAKLHGVRRPGRERLLPPHQQEPAKGLRQAELDRGPCRQTSRRSAATASPPRWTATPSPPATTSSWTKLGIPSVPCHQRRHHHSRGPGRTATPVISSSPMS